MDGSGNISCLGCLLSKLLCHFQLIYEHLIKDSYYLSNIQSQRRILKCGSEGPLAIFTSFEVVLKTMAIKAS